MIRLRPRDLPTASAGEATALLGLIERASADPAVDLDRMERLYDMYERASARAAKSAFLDALMRAKASLPRIIKTGEIQGNVKDDRGNKTGKAKQSSYAKWEEVCAKIEPVLAQHGLVLSFRTEQPGLDRVSVTGVLTHRDGHSEQAQMSLAIDATGGKNNAQGWGSSISYGKRYTAFALLNLVGHDDKDNDGRGPSLSDEQQSALQARIGEVGADVTWFLELLGFPSLSDVPAASFRTAMNLLDAKAKAKARGNGGGQ